MIFEVPVRKIEKLKAAIRAALNCQSVPVCDIARIAGYLISMTFTLGPIARLNSLGICILSLRVEGLGAIMFCF